MDYNIWNAAAYEVTNLLSDFDARWNSNHIVKLIRSHCFTDWVLWKTERTMVKVDKQVEAIKEEWKRIDDAKYVKPIIREYEPDGSKAQELLGGTLQISAPWYKNGENTFTITTPPVKDGGD